VREETDVEARKRKEIACPDYECVFQCCRMLRRITKQMCKRVQEAVAMAAMCWFRE